MENKHAPILKRVGTVLLIVGLVDIAVMAYCIANDMPYSSSFNVFAVAAGVFLLRKSLRAASFVRRSAVFMLSALSPLLIAWTFMQPMDLALTQIRLNPGVSVRMGALAVFVLSLLFWLARELGREPILAEYARAGLKQRDIRFTAGLGVLLAIVLGASLTLLLGGESADRAKSLAEQQVGSGYRFHVSSLRISKNSGGTFVSGVVTAWNEEDIRSVPVQWEER